MRKGIGVREILKMIPEGILEKIGKETAVDRHVKKLRGKSIFQLFLYTFLNSDRVSLRVMENYYQTEQFRSFTGEGGITKHTSLSDRLRKIKPAYFGEILDFLIRRMEKIKLDRGSNKIARFDSSIITLSSQLLRVGLLSSAEEKRQIKLTVGFNGIPKQIKIFSDNSHVGSEELALKEAILAYSDKRDEIIVFDRGLCSRKTFHQMDEEHIQFITRINNKARYKEINRVTNVAGETIGNLTIQKDIEVQLAAKGTRWLSPRFRLIIATPAEGETLCFLTNIRDLTAKEITEIYKKRWDIEVFFRFIKQELNAKHFISRDLNGIQVTLYMIMILAVMLLIYKLVNQMSGYKHVKIRFKNELEMEIIKDIVLFCGGDPKRLDKRWRASS